VNFEFFGFSFIFFKNERLRRLMTTSIQMAFDFARQKHEGQMRKFKKAPYIEHPQEVVKILQQYTNNETIICAAYLHDVLEDTETSYQEIILSFNIQVANIVLELTSLKEKALEMGKAQYLTTKINHMSSEARLIKLADRFHNVSEIEKSPKDFSLKYAKETAFILQNVHFTPTEIEEELITKIWDKINPILSRKLF
jgi:(p)ppGpp synthase/HD superfamily hydrolase